MGRTRRRCRIPRPGVEVDSEGAVRVTTWTDDELARIGRANELQIASRRPDGSLRPFVTIWVVRSGDDVYVRSAHGYANPWFQRALKSRDGRIRAGGVERDVAFEDPVPDIHGDVDAAYHVKYDRYGPRMVGTVVSPEAHRSTLRLMPR
ncbi:MAG: DUF2255 family protein [Chloroflexi bacterium]|nr:MAG: DUF2255 family protein [Chloroflexota bacterium]